jgi:hypothetical protein
MVIDIYVLNRNLEQIGIIDSYKSLIWAKRYNKLGDCELYLDASSDGVNLLKIGNYLYRNDDDMICQIRKVEIDTSAINGNYIICNGVDVKAILDQRIIWTQNTCTGLVEQFIRKLVSDSCISPSIPSRAFKLQNGSPMLALGAEAGFGEVVNEQVTYKNLGEKIRDYCKTFQYGYRLRLSDGILLFELYKGKDLRDTVIFSSDYENLISTRYQDDSTDLGNVALVGGSGEGAERLTTTFGSASSTERYEIFVDAKDVNSVVSYEELLQIYPLEADGGQGYVDGSYYRMRVFDAQIYDANQFAWLQRNYPEGHLVTIDGVNYWRDTDVRVADLETTPPEDNTNCTFYRIVYNMYLLARGAENLSEYGKVITFEGSVVPDVTFVYKEDYNLGDVVTVVNEYGITASARIAEVVEVLDDRGYSLEPKFEYQEDE